MRERYARILELALPLMAGSLVEALYNLTDAFFLGKLGAAEIGAPSIAFSFVVILIVVGSGLSSAGTTLIAQARGRGEAAAANRHLNQTAGFMLMASLALSVLGAPLSPLLLRLVGTPAEVFPYARSYLSIIFLGLPFSYCYFILQASMTAAGDAFSPLKVHLIAVGANVVLAPLLIFGYGPFPRLGVAGAAIATVLAQGLGAFLSLRILIRGRHGLRLRLQEMRPRLEAMALVAKVGLPSSAGMAFEAMGFTVLQGLVNRFGPAAIAAFGVGNRIIALVGIPSAAIGGATTALVGHAIGAGELDRAHSTVRSSLLLCAALLVPPLLLSVAYGPGLVRFFIADPEAMRLGGIMFRIVSPSVLVFGMFVVLTGAFQGAGDTRIIMLLSIVRLWVIRVPLAWALALYGGFGPLSIWYAMFVSNTVVALAGFLHYRAGRWTRALLPGPGDPGWKASRGPKMAELAVRSVDSNGSDRLN
ncbi:MAG TPA: MATE family efflux transporter [Rectinemataceae bacterium]|nr:MATE family efflux transporter [Rectinemataceae bacterium]